MIDMENVIKGLECHYKGCEHKDGSICPYWEVDNCIKQLVSDALTLLREKKHSGETFTVIDTKTGKEADEYAIALHEDWAKHLCYCDMEGWAIENDGTLLLVDECGRFAYADRERFKVVWDA